MVRPGRLTRMILLVLAVSVVVGVSGAEARDAGKSNRACSLLTSADLEGVLGTKLARPLAGMEVPYTKDANHDHDGSVLTCQGKAGARFVTVVFGTQPVTPEGRRRGEAKAKESEEKLLKAGYSIESKEFGSVPCWTMLPPPGDKSSFAVFGSNCGGTKGDYFYSISISATGKADLVPIERLKALTDKAASRLP
jgi:hypothetical protein